MSESSDDTDKRLWKDFAPKHVRELDDKARVVLAAAASVDAREAWFVGADKNSDTTKVQVALTRNSLGEVQEMRSTRPSPNGPPPLRELPKDEDLDKAMAEGSLMVLKVQDETQKGFIYLRRPLKREFGEEGAFTALEQKIARYIAEANTRYLIGENPYEPGSFEERCDYLKGLDNLLMKQLQLRSPKQAQHVERMSSLVELLAEDIGNKDRVREKGNLNFPLSEEELVELYWLARVHDADKGQVPVSILNGTRKLSPEEMEMERMRAHAINTWDILNVPLLTPAMALSTASHHMQPTGEGYPFGISEDPFSHHLHAMSYFNSDQTPILRKDMPVAVGLLQGCDVIEAATGGRSYQQTPESGVQLGAVLRSLTKGALAQEIHPWLFRYIVESETLDNYFKANKHFDHSKAAWTDFHKARDEIMHNSELKKLAHQYAPTMLHTPDEIRPDEERLRPGPLVKVSLREYSEHVRMNKAEAPTFGRCDD